MKYFKKLISAMLENCFEAGEIMDRVKEKVECKREQMKAKYFLFD